MIKRIESHKMVKTESKFLLVMWACISFQYVNVNQEKTIAQIW